jgi:hypothetical protein
MISTAFKSELSKAIIEKIVTKSDASNLDEFFFLKKKMYWNYVILLT